MSDCSSSSRRRFVTVSSAALVTGFTAGCASETQAPPPAVEAPADRVVQALTEAARNAMTPDAILERARDGNRRFLEGKERPRDFLAEQRATAAGQFPAAAVLSCIDSRGSAEIIFELGLGDIFNTRMAGNVVNPDVLGGLEFATKLSGARLVAVLGHSACGAVKGAIAAAELGNLTQLLAKIKPAIEATSYDGERTANNPAFVDAVARTHVRLMVAAVRTQSPVIAALEAEKALKVVGGFHDLATGAVEFFDVAI